MLINDQLKFDNLFLIGYRCTGKSTVGRLLSKELGWSFIDTDSLLVTRQKMSIKDIVDLHGWEGFRQMEYETLKKVCALNGQVVATGGGIVLDKKNMMLMQKCGKIVWLKAKPETIEARMLKDKNTSAFRPALALNDSISEIEETLYSRKPLYQEIMDFFVDTDDQDIRKISEIIIDKLKAQ